MKREQVVETTLGDLIVALTEEASAFVRDQRDVSKVVAFALVRLLNGSNATSGEPQLWH